MREEPIGQANHEDEKADDGAESIEQKPETKKKPILMAKIENVYHEPFEMTQEVKVSWFVC